MRGKLIVIEGTDCSGKETQSKLLKEKLNKNGIKTEIVSFPCYDTPTGKIIGGPLLGKEKFGNSFFIEGAPNVSAKLVSLYYAADRLYNIDKIRELINNGTNVILDRYVYSNMAFQGSKMNDDLERIEFFKWIEKLEFEHLELPRTDINIFLHMPTEKTVELLSKRSEKMDGNERDKKYLEKCEQTYFLIAKKYNFKTIECVLNDNIKSIEQISDELYEFILRSLK